jgi:hypothetical protein
VAAVLRRTIWSCRRPVNPALAHPALHPAPMRTILLATATLALSACGYSLAPDPEMEEALQWARWFKAEQPDRSRAIAKACEKELTASPYFARDGALQLFTCIRREAEAQGLA